MGVTDLSHTWTFSFRLVPKFFRSSEVIFLLIQLRSHVLLLIFHIFITEQPGKLCGSLENSAF